MRIPVFVTNRARLQLEVIDSWWRAHRSYAPELLTEEFLALADLLSVLPGSGQKYLTRGELVVRRSLLRATRYHVYFRSLEDRVVIVSIWSAVRGTGPDLDALSSE